MAEFSLRLDHDNEITLPAELASSGLTLAEIGALACLTAIVAAPHLAESFAARADSADMRFARESLQDKGVLTLGLDSGKLTISINVDAATA